MKETNWLHVLAGLVLFGASWPCTLARGARLRPSAAATKVVKPYLKEGERVFLLGKVQTGRSRSVEILCLVPDDMSDQTVRAVLADWADRINSREKLLFPVVPVQDSGRIDRTKLALRIRQASLMARVWPDTTEAKSPYRISPDDARKVEQTYKLFARFHVFDDAQLGTTDAVEEMVASLAPEHMAVDRDSLPKVLKVTAKLVEAFWTTEGLAAAKANDVWNGAYNVALGQGVGQLEAMKLADRSSRFYDRIWEFQSKHATAGQALGMGISQGTAVLQRVLAALAPAAFLDGVGKDLAAIRYELPNTAQGRMLRLAIAKVLPRVRGQVNVFPDRLLESLSSREFLVDMTVPAVKFVVSLLAKRAAAWGVPFIGKALLAFDAGLFLGDLLANNAAISREFESAKYAKDIEPVLHFLTYSILYRRVRVRTGLGTVREEDLRAFEAGVRLTFLCESYFWRKITTGLNSTTPIKNAFDRFVGRKTGPEVAKTLLALARTPAKASAQWHDPSVVTALLIETLKRLSPIRVVYIEGPDRPEYQHLRQCLKGDAGIELVTFHQRTQNTFVARGKIDRRSFTSLPSSEADFKRFDVLILGGLDRTFLSRTQMRQIQQFVRRGGGLLMIGADRGLGPGGYGGTDIEKVLPVEVGPRNQPRDSAPFLPALTKWGREHPVFAGLTAFFPGRQGPGLPKLPKLTRCVTVAIKPGTTVLAVHPTRRGRRGPVPLLVCHVYGEGRAAVFAADGTWRLAAASDQQCRRVHRRFWVQLVRFLATSWRTRRGGRTAPRRT